MLEMDSSSQNLIPVEALPNIVLPKPVIELGADSIEVKISHIYSPSSFYIQRKSNEEYFEVFTRNLTKHYSKYVELPIDTLDLPKFSTWAIRAQGKKWFRAVVIKKIEPKSDKSQKYRNETCFEMLLVDFGSTEVVKIEDISVLEETFGFDPPFAVQCRLAQVFPLSKWDTNPWEEAAKTFFRSFCSEIDDNLIAHFCEQNRDDVYDVLIVSPNDLVLNEEIVLNGFATSTVIESFIEGGGTEDNLVNQEVENQDKTPEISKKKEKQEAKLEDEAQRLLEEWDPMLNEFTESKKYIYKDNERVENVFNAVDFSSDRNICYSYRNTGRCVRGETCRWRHIIPRADCLPDEKTCSYMNLEAELCLPSRGNWVPGIVSAIYSPTEFYIQIATPISGGRERTYNDNYSILQKEMKSSYSGTKNMTATPALAAVGELMVACCDGGVLPGVHRVRIVDSEHDGESTVKVNFLDVGIEGFVEDYELRPLLPKFVKTPAQAVRCHLEGIQPVSKKWGTKARKLMEKYVDNKTLIIVVAQESDPMEESLGVILVDPQTAPSINSLNNLLVKDSLARD